MAVTNQQVAEIYVATFNRAPDATGLDYWVNDSFDGNPTIDQIAMSFFDQAETQALYPEGNTDTEFVTSIFQNLFNRAPDADGLAYWIGDDALGGGMHRSVMIQAVKNGATGTDADIIANKAEVGLYYADNVKGGEEYSLADVTDDDDTVTSAKAEIDAIDDPTTPADFNLTTGIDDVAATKDGESITGIVDTDNSVSTLNAGDVIDGAGYSNITMKAILDGTNYAGTAIIKDVQTINIQDVGGNNFVAVGVTGAEEMWSYNSTGALTITNIDSLDTAVGVYNSTQNLTANWSAALLTGTEDEATVMFDTVTGGASTVTLSNGIETANIMSTGSVANDIDMVDPTTAGTGGLAKLVIDGAQDLRARGTVDAGVTEIDATDFTGDLRMDDVDGGVDLKVTGGTGDDRFNFTTQFDKNDTVDGGDGNDTLEWTVGANLSSANISNIEVLRFNDITGADRTVDLDGIADITTVIMESAALATQDVTLQDIATTAVTLEFQGPQTAGAKTFDGVIIDHDTTTPIDELAVNIGNLGKAADSITINNLEADKVKGLTITAADVGTDAGEGLTFTDAVSMAKAETFTLSSNSDVDFASGINASTNLDTIDATGADANVDFGAVSELADGVNIELGDGNDTIDLTSVGAGAGSFTIDMGKGNDMLTINAASSDAGNSITLGAGTDTVALDNTAHNGTFEDFTAGTGGDIFANLTGATDGVATLTQVESLAAGAVAATTGFAIYTGNDLASGDAAGFEDLSDGTTSTLDFASTGDTIYMAASDGTDTYIAKIVDGDSSVAIASGEVTILGVLDGVDDATDLTAANLANFL